MPLEVTADNSTSYVENRLVGLSYRSRLILAVLFNSIYGKLEGFTAY